MIVVCLLMFMLTLLFQTDATSPANDTLDLMMPVFDVNAHDIAKRATEGNVTRLEARCVDQHQNCRKWAKRSYCDHKDYKKFMSVKCKKSCYICQDVQSNGHLSNDDNTCVDEKEQCSYWTNAGYCTNELYVTFMKTFCKRSCGNCATQQTQHATSVSPTIVTEVVSSTATSPINKILENNATTTIKRITWATQEMPNVSTESLSSGTFQTATASINTTVETDAKNTTMETIPQITQETTTVSTDFLSPRTFQTAQHITSDNPTTLSEVVTMTATTPINTTLKTEVTNTTMESITRNTQEVTAIPTETQFLSSWTSPTAQHVTSINPTTLSEVITVTETMPINTTLATDVTNTTMESVTWNTQEASTVSTEPILVEPSPTGCIDKVSFCKLSKAACNNSDFAQICMVTCGLCQPIAPVKIVTTPAQHFTSVNLTTLSEAVTVTATTPSNTTLETDAKNTTMETINQITQETTIVSTDSLSPKTFQAAQHFTSVNPTTLSEIVTVTATTSINSTLETEVTNTTMESITTNTQEAKDSVSKGSISFETSRTAQPVTECVDRVSYCKLLKATCNNSDFALTCPATCGLCQPNAPVEIVTTPEETSQPLFKSTTMQIQPETDSNLTFTLCNDRLATCQYFSPSSCNSSNIMQTFCQKTCGLCHNTAPSTTLWPATDSIMTSGNSIDVQPISDFSFVSTQFVDARATPTTTETEVSSFATYSTGGEITFPTNKITNQIVTHRTTISPIMKFEIATSNSPTTDTACVDDFVECASVSVFCGLVTNVTESCRRTCGTCVSSLATAAITPPTTQLSTTESVCEDIFPTCREMISSCFEPESKIFLSKTCRKTCGFCTDQNDTPITGEGDECNDTNEICAIWTEAGFCNSTAYPKIKGYMEVHCRNSCKLCDESAWSQWTQCSSSCGGGKQTRRKLCSKATCIKPSVENRSCAKELCPLKPNACQDQMSAEACKEYHEKDACLNEPIKLLCRATCGYCVEESTDVENANASSTIKTQDGLVCEDKHELCSNWTKKGFCSKIYTKYMKTHCSKSCGVCDVWKPWTTWSLCNARCDGGVQTRSRLCVTDECMGPTDESISCNTFRCHSCFDQSSSCTRLGQIGKCREIFWKFFCKFTCGLCDPEPISGRCADTKQECANVSRIGHCSNPYISRACPVSCGKCIAPTQIFPNSAVASTSTTCVDKDPNCSLTAKAGRCSQREIKSICSLSCGLCLKKTTDPIFPNNAETVQCNDQLSVCPDLISNCENALVKRSCPKSCGVCQTTAVGCIDEDEVCPKLAALGQCEVNELVAKSCRRSCDPSCQWDFPSSVTEPFPKCADKIDNCPILTNILGCGDDFASRSCAKTCGLCLKSTQGFEEEKCQDNHSKCRELAAQGQCQKMFIQFLCPITCDSCQDDDVTVPICHDQLGISCEYLKSRCSSSVVRYGCEKTCQVCSENSCQDKDEVACVALAKIGMCSRSSFKVLCPSACGVCTGVAKEVIVDGTDGQCEDDRDDCSMFLQLGFCADEPMIRNMCRKTCGVCENVEIAEKEYPCIDFNDKRCELVKATGQCNTNTSLTLFCAKSCKLCKQPQMKKTSRPTCQDEDPIACNLAQQFCNQKSIWRKCPQTCNRCMDDKEGQASNHKNDNTEDPRCVDAMLYCDQNKQFCGVKRWMHYMDSMCRKMCNACGKGTWSEWGKWSECTKTCNDVLHAPSDKRGGQRIRTRHCIGGFCSGDRKLIGRCNKDDCPDIVPAKPKTCYDSPDCEAWENEGKCGMQQYSNFMKITCPIACGLCTPGLIWSSWSNCSAECGNGTQTRTQVCEAPGRCLNNPELNTIEEEKCMIKPCDLWKAWSSWSKCSSSCASGSRLRTRVCEEGRTVGSQDCPGSVKEESACLFNPPCPVWTQWSKWSSCSVSCDNGTKTRSRNCSNEQANFTCDGKSEDTVTCNSHPCTAWSEWQSWSDCSVSCGGVGKQERKRTCPGVNHECGDASDAKENRTCGEATCSQWNQWSQWSECNVFCESGGIQERSRTCQFNQTCSGKSTDTRDCNSTVNSIGWSVWSDFTKCSASCGGGVSVRNRTCNAGIKNETNDEKCSGNAVQAIPCNCQVCPNVGVWSPWGKFGNCSVSCGNGTKLRRRMCIKGIPNHGSCRGSSHDEQACTNDACPIGKWKEWTSWSECSVTCGYGIRIKERNCIDGKVGVSGCSGMNEGIEECNTSECPSWSPWQAWSACSASCGSDGVRTRIVTCFDSSTNKTVNGLNCEKTDKTPYTQEESCNVKPCPYWGSWSTWGTCSAPCGVGWTERNRTCLNRNVAGNDGCDKGSDKERELCNEWDCQKLCPLISMDINSFPAESFSASSEQPGFEAYRINLDENLAWCPQETDLNPWIQIDLAQSQSVSGISVQGYYKNTTIGVSWVSKFLIMHRKNRQRFRPILDNAGRSRLFIGSQGPFEITTRHWGPIMSQHWRIRILQFKPRQAGCLRFDLLACAGSRIPDTEEAEGSGLQ